MKPRWFSGFLSSQLRAGTLYQQLESKPTLHAKRMAFSYVHPTIATDPMNVSGIANTMVSK